MTNLKNGDPFNLLHTMAWFGRVKPQADATKPNRINRFRHDSYGLILKPIRVFSSPSVLASLLTLVSLTMVNNKLFAQCPSTVDPLASLASRFRVIASTNQP